MTDTRRGRGRGGRRPASKGAPKGPPVQPLEPTAEPPAIESFREFDLGDSVQGAIAEMGITSPTPIQALAIGPVLEGRHVIAKAETGTGKTLAFGAPMMAKIDPARRTVLGLVLSPTRELAEQVHDVLAELGKPNDVKVALVVGGEPLQPQVKALQEGAQVVVGTPGRVLDLMGQGFLTFPWTEFVVLDEADKMLEIGFLEDIEKILAQVNEYRRPSRLRCSSWPVARRRTRWRSRPRAGTPRWRPFASARSRSTTRGVHASCRTSCAAATTPTCSSCSATAGPMSTA